MFIPTSYKIWRFSSSIKLKFDCFYNRFYVNIAKVSQKKNNNENPFGIVNVSIAKYQLISLFKKKTVI